MLALIGDVNASRESTDRAALQRRFEEAVAHANKKHAGSLAASLAVTAGDEVHGLFSEPAAALDVIIEIEEAMLPDRLAFGLGWGEIHTEMATEATRVDGRCFHLARAGLEEAKRLRRWAMVRGFEEPLDGALSALFALMGVVRAGWTDRQAQYVTATRRLPSRRAVAQAFKVSPSVVTESLQAAHYDALCEAEEAVRALLPEASGLLEAVDALRASEKLPKKAGTKGGGRR